jgi:hypothetical protein
VWPYLLGYYKFGSTESSRQDQDELARQQYEQSMSEWLAIEAIINQRDREATAAPAAATDDGAAVRNRFSESQDGTNGVDLPAAKMKFFRKDSSLSNDVFESVDGPTSGIIQGGDEVSRPETVIEESSSATTPTVERASVATDASGAIETGSDAGRRVIVSGERSGEFRRLIDRKYSMCVSQGCHCCGKTWKSQGNKKTLISIRGEMGAATLFC